MVAHLPTELIQLIYMYQSVTPTELRACRLVNRQWNAAATPLLFDRVNVSLFSRSLAKLSALSQSPEIAKHVKAVDFHPDPLPQFNRPEWEESIDTRPSFAAYCQQRGEDGGISRLQSVREHGLLPRHTYTPEELDAGWKAYETHCVQQNNWTEEKEGDLLSESLARLRNLKQVVCARTKPFRGVGKLNDIPFWRHLSREILIGPDAWTFMTSLTLKDALSAHEAVSTFFLVQAVALRDEVAGMNPIESFELDMPERFSLFDMIYVQPEYPFYHQMGRGGSVLDSNIRYTAITRSFRSLKHLVLRCPKVEDPVEWPGQSQANELAEILNMATNLQSLNLEISEPDAMRERTAEDSVVDWGLVPLLCSRSTTWPCLQELKLSATFDPMRFIKVLRLHSETLTRLELSDCMSSDWDAILDFIAKDLKKLEHIYLESLWQLPNGFGGFGGDPDLLLGEGLDDDSEYARLMKKFLLTGEGKMPPRNEDDREVYESEDEEGDSEFDSDASLD